MRGIEDENEYEDEDDSPETVFDPVLGGQALRLRLARMCLVRLSLPVVLATLVACEAAVPSEGRKLIVFGYDTQMPEKIRTRMNLYEASPFDGMVIGAKLPRTITLPDGREFDRLDWVTWGVELDDEDFAPAIEHLAARRDSGRYTELFFRANFTPGADWFDDEAFARTVLPNWRRLGRLVREGRLAGLLVDAEQYPRFDPPFSFDAVGRDGLHHLGQCLDQVYRRGRQVMRVLNEEVDDLDLLFIVGTAGQKWLRYKSVADRTDIRLLPAFIDGMMAEATDGTRFHDVWEGAYRYKDRQQFELAREIILGPEGAETSLAPQVYLDRIRCGFGIWICDVKGVWDPDAPYYTPQDLERTVRHAFDLSDRYVWIYHERIQPWGLDHPSQVRFPDAYFRALERAAAPWRGPARHYRRERPQAAAPEDPSDSPALVAHWPLLDSPQSAVPGVAALTPRRATFDSGFLMERWIDDLAVSLADLPGGLDRDATVMARFRPGEAGTRAYTLLNGTLSPKGPAFDLTAIGDGTLLRLEMTVYDPVSGRPAGWQRSGHYYPAGADLQVTVRFCDGRFDGVFVNDHRAIFGLWDLGRTPRDFKRRAVRRDGLNVGMTAHGPRLADGQFEGVVADLRIYRGAMERAGVMDFTSRQ
ncbi:MAG: hypothetical protein CMJ18_05095 [Phycisphaeraceae bacterium]|nr:hypothetical protein [Phycisphaeraceae bacterium]